MDKAPWIGAFALTWANLFPALLVIYVLSNPSITLIAFSAVALMIWMFKFYWVLTAVCAKTL